MTCIKSTLVFYRSCVQIIRLQDLLSIRHIQKANPGGAHPRAPTWRKVTTEILELRADPTLARGETPPAICVTSRAPKGAGSRQAPALLARRRPRPCGEGRRHLKRKGLFLSVVAPRGHPGLGCRVWGRGHQHQEPVGAAGATRPTWGKTKNLVSAGGPGAAGNSCTWGERVNTKKKGTAALLLNI